MAIRLRQLCQSLVLVRTSAKTLIASPNDYKLSWGHSRASIAREGLSRRNLVRGPFVHPGSRWVTSCPAVCTSGAMTRALSLHTVVCNSGRPAVQMQPNTERSHLWAMTE